jgi:hypothetical protein
LLAYGNYITFRIPFDTCPCRFESRRCPPGTQHSNRHSYFKFIEVFFLMIRILVGIVSLFVLGFALACSSTDTVSNSNANFNANQVVGVGNVNVDPNNLPEGLSASPVPPSSNTTPGIPDPKAANAVPKGTTPTPGIPSAEELKKGMKPGATPTPGIPSPDEIRRQMQGNANAGTPTTSGESMMRSRKSPRPVNGQR